ncbi:MAG: hypothetical protein WBI83_00270, partial [bacterium]
MAPLGLFNCLPKQPGGILLAVVKACQQCLNQQVFSPVVFGAHLCPLLKFFPVFPEGFIHFRMVSFPVFYPLYPYPQST